MGKLLKYDVRILYKLKPNISIWFQCWIFKKKHVGHGNALVAMPEVKVGNHQFLKKNLLWLVRI
jgi:hypothetical protein